MSTASAARNPLTSHGSDNARSAPNANSSKSNKSTRIKSGRPKRSHPRKTVSRTPAPNDVLTDILCLLDESELIRCLRVSKNVHRLAIPYLYPKLYSTLTIDLSAPINPISIDGTPITSIWNQSHTLTIPKFLLPAGETKLAFVSRIVDADPLPNRFDYTTHLTLTSHDRLKCHKLSPLIMPNLHTLRVKPCPNEDYLDLCRDHQHHSDPVKGAPHSSSTTCCPIILNLRPKRLILGGLGTVRTLSGSLTGLWSAKNPFPPFITDLVVLIGLTEDTASNPVSVLRSLLKSVERTMVVASLFEAGWDLTSRIHKENGGNLEGMHSGKMGDIINDALLFGSIKSLEIVGWTAPLIGCVRGDAVPPKFKSLISYNLRAILPCYGKSMRRVEDNKFTREAIFEEEENWYTEAKTEWSAADLNRKLRKKGVKKEKERSISSANPNKDLTWQTATATERVKWLVSVSMGIAVLGGASWVGIPLLFKATWVTLRWSSRMIWRMVRGTFKTCWNVGRWTFPIPLGYVVFGLYRRF